MGKRPTGSITVRELLGVLRRVEERSALSVVHLALRECGRIFRYAVITGRAERDVAADLRGAFAPAPRGHRAAITGPAAVGELLRRIDGYEGNFFVSRAGSVRIFVRYRSGIFFCAAVTHCPSDYPEDHQHDPLPVSLP